MKEKCRMFFLPVLCVALCLALVSCKKDYTGKEKTHPVFVKAGTASKSGDYAGAVKFYEEFLLVAPKSAETHMQLATIYGDNLDSPLKAVYHYEKVMELRPDDTINNDNIRSFISQAKKKLYDQLKLEYYDKAGEEAVKAELAKEREMLKKYKEYSEKLRTLLLTREKKWLEYKKRVERRGAGAVKAPGAEKKNSVKAGNIRKKETVSGTGKTDPKKVVKKETVDKGTEKTLSASGVLGRHTVKKGETLRSIARKYYGNAKYYKLIAEANKGKLPANFGVRVGQVLVIPRLPAKGKK